ncbi:MAG: iron-sulfur cluster assembly scaffold protein [Clostridiales bacterium]|jgi:nitrogen fixation NifU-like protein|nr:iron-sulfur cluster assembly scaffold protein [Clostridiales bacterium]
MEYTAEVLDHFMHPRNVGDIEDASGSGTVGNARCGDIMKVDLKIEDGVITDAKFKTFGCGAAIATSSMATTLIIGKPVGEAIKLTNKTVMDALKGLPPVKVHCSCLAEEAVRSALWDYVKKNGVEIEGLAPPKDEAELEHIGLEGLEG